MLNRDQLDALSNAFLNLGVGIVLMGGFGPMIIQTELRHEFWLIIGGSLTIGVMNILAALYTKR